MSSQRHRCQFGVINLDQANVLAAEGLADVDPLLVPADPAIVTDASDLIMARIRSFAYVDLMFVHTPLADHSLVRRLEKLTPLTDMQVRFERVRAFVEYLERKELAELAQSAERGGPFQDRLVNKIRSRKET